MKRHIPIFTLLLCAFASVGSPGQALAFDFYLFSNYKSTFVDCYGCGSPLETTEELPTEPKRWTTADNYTIKANELQGYRFLGWFTKLAGWGNVNPEEITAANVDSDPFVSTAEISGEKIGSAGTAQGDLRVIVAKYVKLHTLTIATDPNDAGTVSTNGVGVKEVIVEDGGSVTLTATPAAGWAFEKWSDGNTTNPRLLSNISAAASYTAVFKPLFKDVTLGKTGGSGGTDSVVVTNGQPLVKIKPPTKTGYDFQGYFTAATGDDATQYYTSSGAGSRSWSADETTSVLYARWSAKTFSVKFDNGGATSGPDPLTVTYGKDPGPLTKVPAKDDYTFDGYYLGTARYWNASGQWVGGSGWTYIPEEGSDVILTARYTPDQYVVKFNANGGQGARADLLVAVDEQFVLPDATGFSFPGKRAFGWAISEAGKKKYDFGATTTVAANKGAATLDPKVLTFYAVWTNAYRVVFAGNGGQGEMKAQSRPYDAKLSLPANEFVRDGFTFLGWATDPTNAVAYADKAEIGDISADGVGDVVLYAKWKSGGSEGDMRFSQALDCTNVLFRADAKMIDQFSVVEDPQAKGGTCVKIRVREGQIKNEVYKLTGSVASGGRLTFSYKTSIADIGTTNLTSQFECSTSETQAVELGRTNEWTVLTYQVDSASDGVGWKLTRKNNDGYDYPLSNDDCAYIDNVIWEPSVTNALTVGVTFRTNDGTPPPRDIVTNATKVVGEKYGPLPRLADRSDKVKFLGWAQTADATDPLPATGWIVPDDADGTQLYAVWSAGGDDPDPPPPVVVVVTNEVPVAVAGLVYDGQCQTGVVEGVNFTIVGNVATNAGDYVATATVTNGVWRGGAKGATNVVWTIAKAPAPDVSGVSFADAAFPYDGKSHSIAVSGTVPEGVRVVYSGDPTNRTTVGANTVTASFEVLDAANYEAITNTLTATLVIEKPWTPLDDGTLYPGDRVGEFEPGVAATYVGWLRATNGAIVATIQVRTTAARSGNPAKTTLTVTPLGGKKQTYRSEIAAGAETFFDKFGIYYGDNAIAGKTKRLEGVPEGATIEAAKDFSKSKDESEKARLSDVPVGCRTLVLPTKAGGWDCLSVTIDKKGKAKVKGTLDDGTALSLSVQGALGADAFAVPIAWSKKITSKATGLKETVTFGFVLWIDREDGAAWIADETGERWAAEDRAVSQERDVSTDDGTHPVRFETPEGCRETSDDGIRLTPDGEEVFVAGKKWSVDKSVGTVKYDAADGRVIVKVGKGKTPANVSKLRLTFAEKTGVVKGSFKLYWLDKSSAKPKVKTESVAVTGITVDGQFHGNAVIRKKGLYAIGWD